MIDQTMGQIVGLLMNQMRGQLDRSVAQYYLPACTFHCGCEIAKAWRAVRHSGGGDARHQSVRCFLLATNSAVSSVPFVWRVQRQKLCSRETSWDRWDQVQHNQPVNNIIKR